MGEPTQTRKAVRDAALRRVDALYPLRAPYLKLERVLWPYVTVGMQPNRTTDFATIDSRGHRLSRRGEETVASDHAPADAAFLIGGSYAFGIGAGSDAGTLTSALWRHSGRPYVNLALPAATSGQELIAVLPFIDRTTTFVVCSGVNNFTASMAAPLDPLYGPNIYDFWVQKLQNVTMEELVHIVRAARQGSAAKLRPAGPRRPRGTKRQAPTDPDEIVASAAAQQLHDLRALRRIVPAEAEVYFVLQPVALNLDKELTEEEEVIFEALDIVQRNRHWGSIKELMATHWNGFARELADGCAKLGVPFADLNDAPYAGWCFVNRIHMNDHGLDLSAAFIVEKAA